MARARSWAAIYVQDFDAPCVLQFAWISALCCALHRSTSLVIHRSGSYKNDILRFVSFLRSLDRVKRKIEREVKKMFRLTRVLDWFCLDEREKKRARSAIGRKRFKSPSLEAPDTRSLVVHRLSCSELSLKRCQLSRSRSPEKKNRLINSSRARTTSDSLRRGNFSHNRRRRSPFAPQQGYQTASSSERLRATTTH